MVTRSKNMIFRLLPEGNSVYSRFTLFKSNPPANFLHCYEVCVSIHQGKKDFLGKGLYMRGTLEVRERSGVFMLNNSVNTPSVKNLHDTFFSS